MMIYRFIDVANDNPLTTIRPYGYMAGEQRERELHRAVPVSYFLIKTPSSIS